MNRIRWAEGLWALLVLLAAALTACGLADTFTFLVEPPTYAVGHRLVLIGSLGFAAAAVWVQLRQGSLWVTVLTALPAAVVGGLALQFEDGGWGALAGLVLIPAALTAMLVNLLFRPTAGGRQGSRRPRSS